MCKIKGKIRMFQQRQSIPKHIKEEIKNKGSYVVKAEKKKLYEYYICDYCNDEIKILKTQQDMTGGIVILPDTLTKKRKSKTYFV